MSNEISDLPFELEEGEQAKDVNNFPNYIITSHGRCFSRSSNRFIGAVNKRTHYVHLALLNSETKRTTYMHILVMEHFGEPKPHDPNAILQQPTYEIDHIDRNTLNNDVNNLKWVTHRENLYNRRDYTPNRKQRATKAEMEAVRDWYIENISRLAELSNRKVAQEALQALGIDITQDAVRINRERWEEAID